MTEDEFITELRERSNGVGLILAELSTADLQQIVWTAWKLTQQAQRELWKREAEENNHGLD